MSFPTQLLEGYRYSVLSLGEHEAKILVSLSPGSLEGLARQIADRFDSAVLERVAADHFQIAHPAFRGDLVACVQVPEAALLEVRATRRDLRQVTSELPAAVGRFVQEQTGSRLFGLAAGVGALALLEHLGPLSQRKGAP